jgi:hypothetical protein
MAFNFKYASGNDRLDTISNSLSDSTSVDSDSDDNVQLDDPLLHSNKP